MSGYIVGVSVGGVTTSAHALDTETARASHFLATLRDLYGSYEEAARHFPDMRRTMEWVGVALSGNTEKHRLPPDRVFRVLADHPIPTDETVQQSLSQVQPPPSDRELRKYPKAARMVAARLNRWLDKNPAWDSYEAATAALGSGEGGSASASLPWDA
ncbi:hypothetical protein P3G55_20810 [Leptospira sp. 96542]|nr:hypothetical protein [Leptospira sp. 96542]